MHRRLATLVSIALVGASLLLLGGLWGLAWHEGQIVSVQRWLARDPDIYTSSGPWGRHHELGLIAWQSTRYACFALFASAGAMVIDRGKTLPLACLVASILMLVVNILHFPLVD